MDGAFRFEAGVDPLGGGFFAPADVFVRADCADAESELACGVAFTEGFALVELEAEQTVYVFVSSPLGGQYSLSVAPFEPEPPAFDDDGLRAVYPAGSPRLGLSVAGSDPDEDAAGMRCELLDEAGVAVPLDEGERAALDVRLTPDDRGPAGRFSARWIVEVGAANLGAAARVRCRLHDGLGLESDPREVALEDPTALDVGAVCGTRDVFTACSAATTCALDAADEETRCAADDALGACDALPVLDGAFQLTLRHRGYNGSCFRPLGGDMNVPSGGVAFTADEAGVFRFSAIGTLHIRTACADPETEVACQDGFQTAVTQRVEAGQTVFVFVNQAIPVGGPPVTIRVERLEPTAPAIDDGSLEVVHDPGSSFVGLRFSGVDPDGDVNGGALELLGPGGEPLALDEGGARAIGFGLDLDYDAGGAFSVSGRLSFDLAPAEVEAARLVITDSTRLESAPVSVAVTPRAIYDADAPCQIGDAFARCPDALRCLGPAPDALTCAVATAPEIDTTGVAHDAARARVALRVAGTDTSRDAIGVGVVVLNGQGAAMNAPLWPELDADGRPTPVVGVADTPTVRIFEQVARDGDRYDGVVDLGLDPTRDCARYADAARLLCFESGGGPFECIMNDYEADCRAALADVADRWDPGAAAAVRLTVYDSAELDSAPVEVALAPGDGDLPAGGVCYDEAYGLCGAGLACLGTEGLSTCGASVLECPAEWPVVELNDAYDAAESAWLHDGDQAGAQAEPGGGSCGGGSPSEVLRFVAPEAGTYHAVLTEASGGPVIYARTHCGAPEIELELACNAGLGPFADGVAGVQFDLDAEAAVYVIVDARDGAEGTYSLRVAAGPLDDGGGPPPPPPPPPPPAF